MTNKLLALAAGFFFSTAALAQVSVTDAWARATVAQQKTAGVFMNVKSASPARLVAVSTPVAASASLHRMQMQGQTMSMHEVDGVNLPAGQEVRFGPGGYHVMLFGLKQQLKAGDSVPLTLVVENGANKREEVKVAVAVKPIAYQPPAK